MRRISGLIAHMKGLRHIDTELARVGIDTYLFHFHQVKELMFTKEQQSSEERFETLVDSLNSGSFSRI